MDMEAAVILLTIIVTILSVVIIALLLAVIVLLIKLKQFAKNMNAAASNLAEATQWLAPAKVMKEFVTLFRRNK